MVNEVDLYRQRKVQAREQRVFDNPDQDAETALPPADLYNVRKEEKRRQNAELAAIAVGKAGNPDENAADDALAAEFKTIVNPGITPPATVVAGNRDMLAAEIQKKKTSTALSASPMLTRWLSNEDNARVAADDVPILADVEAGLGHARDAIKRGVVDRGTQVGAQIGSDVMLYSSKQYGKTFAERYAEARGDHYGYGLFGKPLKEGEYTKPDGSVDLKGLQERGDEPVGAFFSALVGTAVDGLNRITGGTAEGDIELAIDRQQQAAEAALSAQATPVSPTAQRALDALHSEEPLSLGEAVKRTLDIAVNDPGALAAMITEVGIESLGAMIPAAVATAATRNPGVGAAVMGGTSYTVERNLAPVEFFTERGYDLSKPEDVKRMLANPELMKEAAELGHTRGLIIGALDLVSGGIAGRALAKNPAADAALQAMVQGGLGGSGEGFAQYATEGEVNFGEVVVEALAEFSTAPVDVAAIGARKLGERKKKAQTAQETSEAMAKLSETAAASKLRERSPEKFKEFVEDATQGGEAENLYIPADDFVSYFQDQGLSLEEVAETLPGLDLEQVKRASATGEDVILPTATYMERIAGSEIDQFVVDNSKFSPQDMTRAEALKFLEDEQLAAARVAAEQQAALETRLANEDVAEQIQQNIIDQLVEAGRPRMAAQQEAQLYPAFYRALADRLGKPIEDVIAEYQPPSVRGPQAENADGSPLDPDTKSYSQFAGPNAGTANKYQLERAQEMIANGASFERTRSETGWHKGVDDKWRFEISDADAELDMDLAPPVGKPDTSNKNKLDEEEWRDQVDEHLAWFEDYDNLFSEEGLALGDVLDHDRLYAAYPQLKTMPVFIDKTLEARGAVRTTEGGDQIILNPETFNSTEEMLSTLLHEVQHAIQRVEGFARGGNLSITENVVTSLRNLNEKTEADVNAWTLANAAKVKDEAYKNELAGLALMYKSYEALINYANSDKPSGVFRLIRSESQWLYSDRIRKSPNEALRQRADTLSRSLYELPKPHKMAERNNFLREYAMGLAHVIRDSMPKHVWDEFKNDPRTLNGMVKGYEREATKARRAVDELRELKSINKRVGETYELNRFKRPYEVYRALAGETEARNTQARADMDDAERRETPPTHTQDVPDGEQIVLMQDGEVSAYGMANARTRVYMQEARGQIHIPRDGVRSGAAVIDLFKNADLSTFLHESSHFFLSVLQDADAQENAPQAVRDMYAQARGWWRSNADAVAKESGVAAADVEVFLEMGTTGDDAKDAAIDVGMQEQWARAFETYLLEGKAPTPALRAAFEQFRAWLMEVYRKVKGDLNVPITDDIRQVFDMLLATDDEIKKAQVDNNGDMLARTADELGVSEDEYAHLAKLHQEAQDQAAAKAIQAAMAPIRRMRDAAYKERHAEIREEVAAEINARPIYRAIEWMGNKRWLGDKPDDKPAVPEGLRLNKEQLVERYGAEVLRKLPRGSFRVYTPDGMDIDEAAGWFGFGSGDELVQAMQSALRREDVISNETDTRAMNELVKDDGIVDAAAEATEAFHTDKRGDYIAAELRTLNRGLGGSSAKTSTASYARQVAKRTIGGMRARDAVASNRYLSAERRAAEKAQEAFANGDRAAAADFKRQQLFNHMMYTESRRVAEEVGKAERLAKRLSSKGTRKNLANSYLGAIDDVLEQYDFRKVGPGKEKSRARMLAYVEMMKEQGRENEIAIPQHILDNAQAEPYMTLEVDRLRGVYSTLRNIESTARRAQKLIDAQSERDMDQVVADIADAFQENVKPKPPSRVETRGERLRQGARQFFDLVLNADTLLREVDGFKDGEGAAYANLKRGIDEATARLQVRRQEAAQAFEDLYSVYEVKERNRMAVAEFVPELNTSMSKWDMIAVVLNMGNADNIQRLTDDRVKGSFTKEQLDAVVARMDKRDLDFVQSVWDYVDSFYDEIAARELRVTGVKPEKVEAQALNTPHGQYKGGYYPLKYDPRLSDRVAEESAEEIMNNMRAGRFGKAQTRNGHTKERAKSSGRAVMLDIGVLHSHINTVLHDLEMSEAVTNTWRILQEPRIKGMFYDSGKQVDHQALEMWVQDTASGQVNSADVLSKTARFLKSGFTVSKLAFNLSTVAVQITGIAQTMVVVGKKDFTKGAIQYLSDPVGTSADVVARSAFMAERETTFNKDIYDVVGDVKVGPKAGIYKRAMQNYIGPASFYLMQKVQFYAVDMPTWIAGYQKALRANGGDEKAAIQEADRTVARAQASGIFSDRSPIERGTLTPTVRQNDFVRMFTALGSYMFAKANVAYERTGKTDFRSPREVLSYSVDMVLLFTVEAILYNAIKGTLPGMGDDDDGEEWAEFLAKETALSVMSTMPFVRDLSSPLQGFSGGGSYGSITETLTKPFLQAAQGEVDKAFVKSMVDSGGMLLHLPASQVNRFIDAGWRASEGEDVAPIEYIMGKR